MPTIKIELGATINQGDFNNVKVNVTFEDSVRKDETPDKAFDRIYNFVETKLQEKIDELDEEEKPKPKKRIPSRTVKRKH